MTGPDHDLDRDSEHPSGPSALRWLALAASAVVAIFGIRLLDRALRESSASPSPTSPAPPRPTPAAQAKRPKPAPRRRVSPVHHKTNGSVPPELADPPLTAPAKASAEAVPATAEPALDLADDLDLDAVLECLDKHAQRATYGAVAAVVGRLPINVMRGRDKTPRHSWVVSQKTGKPTNYKAAELHPELTANEHVIRDADELRTWLAERG
ncbi:MAG: hypothetical protein AAGE94_10575 [Acidobacteriota bacterium]